MDIATADVHRLDRLITDIAEASRMDAQLTRTRFEKMDIGQLLERLLAERDARGANNSIRIAFARPQRGSTTVMGDPGRIERMFDNLLDNAISFSPENGGVQVSATASDGQVIASVEDEGPGVSADRRDAIFERFHSDRPDIAAFGRHSGLGLSIARTIVLAHDGTIDVRDRPSGARGAMFVVTLPSAGRRRS
jgi:two-component system sensor histidine kinase ChvG